MTRLSQRRILASRAARHYMYEHPRRFEGMIMLFARKKSELPTVETALKGRADPIPTAKVHHLNHRALKLSLIHI